MTRTIGNEPLVPDRHSWAGIKVGFHKKKAIESNLAGSVGSQSAEVEGKAGRWGNTLSKGLGA